MTPAVATTALEVRRGGVTVLHDVTMSVAPGEIVAVLGPNGAGKSTLVETIGGLLSPSAGTVIRNGRVAAALQPADLAFRSSRANVELALAWWGTARGQRRVRAEAALAEMNATPLAARQAQSLSGGERRRIHLARAIAVKSDLLLLDEPFAGLDPASRAALLDDTGAALRRNAGAVLIVVHDRAEAWALADRIIVLLDGHVAASGPPREVLERPPSPEVARFLGFTGELRVSSGTVLTRPTHVVLDPTGDIDAVVTRLVPTEDGARAELEVADGRLAALVPLPGPAVGDRVRVRVTGGIRFPATGG
jgi:ATPase subunit of ABC transporter with duplicated ATPase domains